MNIEIGNTRPDNFIDRWPGEFRMFSHFEMAFSDRKWTPEGLLDVYPRL